MSTTRYTGRGDLIEESVGLRAPLLEDGTGNTVPSRLQQSEMDAVGTGFRLTMS